MLSKAQDRALHVVELLDSILHLLEPADLAACARVCRFWELPSLRILWRDSPPHDRDFFKILGDLNPWDGPIVSHIASRIQGSTTKRKQRFIDAPGLDKWERLYRYASLIKGTHITIQKGSDERVNSISPRTIQQIRLLAEAERVPLFPNLVDLTLTPMDQSSCEVSIFFITDIIRYLVLEWEACQPSSVLPHLQRARYCTELTELDISFESGISSLIGAQLDSVAKGLAQTLTSLAKLEVVRLPSILAFEPCVWHAMQQLPAIRKIEGSGCVALCPTVFDHLDLGTGFDKLESLVCYPTSREAMKLLTPIHPNTHLKKIDMVIRTQTPTSGTTSLGTFFNAIPDGFLRVEDVTVTLEDSEEPVLLCHIAPLFQLSQLVNLTVDTTRVASLSDGDYGVLGRSLPNLRKLSISKDPDIYVRPSATLLALSNIAAHCQCIEWVELVADVSLDALPCPETYLTPFSASLGKITFGPSIIENPEKVAYVLSRMLLWCQPYIITTVPSEDVSEEVLHQYEAATVGWRKVADTLKSLRPLVHALKVALQENTGVLNQQTDARMAQLEAA